MYFPIVSELIGVGRTWLEGRQQASLAKQEAKARIAEAKTSATIKQIENAANADTNYDLEALRQTQFSWKDEFLTVFVCALIALHFIPATQPFMAAGWAALSTAPQWFSFVVAPGVFVAGLGLRWMYQKRFK